jgi:hypothetical protein
LFFGRGLDFVVVCRQLFKALTAQSVEEITEIYGFFKEIFMGYSGAGRGDDA